MPVSKVVFGGRPIIDITDSTVTPATMLHGAVAYNAHGERIVGTAAPGLSLPRCRSLDVVFSADKWGGDQWNYTQTISAPVKKTDAPFSQIKLSSNYDTANDELGYAATITRIYTDDGTVTAVCTGIDKPDIDLHFTLTFIEGVTEATQLSLANSDSRQAAVLVSASKWTGSNGVYQQTVPVNVRTGDVIFIDSVFSIAPNVAMSEMEHLLRITDALVQDGSLQLTVFDTDSVGPPDIDLTLALKIFERME